MVDTIASTARYGRHQRRDGWGFRPDIATAASEEQRVTDKDDSDEVTVETTSVFRADFLNELDDSLRQPAASN